MLSTDRTLQEQLILSLTFKGTRYLRGYVDTFSLLYFLSLVAYNYFSMHEINYLSPLPVSLRVRKSHYFDHSAGAERKSRLSSGTSYARCDFIILFEFEVFFFYKLYPHLLKICVSTIKKKQLKNSVLNP